MGQVSVVHSSYSCCSLYLTVQKRMRRKRRMAPIRAAQIPMIWLHVDEYEIVSQMASIQGNGRKVSN